MAMQYDGPGNVSVTRFRAGTRIEITAPGDDGRDHQVRVPTEHVPGLIGNLALALNRPALAEAFSYALANKHDDDDDDEGLTFGDALNALRAGQRVARRGWNGKGWLRLNAFAWSGADLGYPHLPRLPYLEMKTAHDELVPWLASQTDMLARDWTVVGPDRRPDDDR